MEKRFGELRKLGDDVKKTRYVEFVISDGTKDRHNSIIDPKGWNLENFNKNGIVGYQHDVYGDSFLTPPDPDSIIGKAVAFMDGDQLIGGVTFEPKEINEKAEKIFQKVLFGTLRATSVGFKKVSGHWGDEEKNEHREGENATYYYDKVELLEFSLVNIPSNPNAVKRKSPQEQAELLNFVAREALGEKFDDRLTLKGMINIIGGDPDAITPDQKYIEELKEFENQINNYRDEHKRVD